METCAQPDKEPSENRQVKRVGMVIGIKPERIEAYKRLHAGPGVRDLLHQANIHNFSIFLQQLDDGRFYEFAYYEYTGDDYEADMAWLGTQPANKKWLALCDPMQIPLPGETGWAVMVFKSISSLKAKPFLFIVQVTKEHQRAGYRKESL